jgi:chitinase
MNLGCWKHSAAQHSSSQPLRLMPDITQQSSTLQIETLTSSSTFWGGLSGSLQLVNSGELMVEPWTFSFRSKYSDFDFYQADETAVLNEDGSYTITISAPSGSAGLAVGDSLSLNFTVNSASDPDVTLAEVVLSDFSTEAGDNSTDAGDNSTDTSTGNETSADEPTGETTGGDSGTDGELSNSASGASVSVELGSSWQGAYEGTITVSNKGSDPIAAGWSVSFISAHQLSNISDFQVDQVARDDGRFTVTLSAPSWNTNQVLAAGTSLSSYFQASGELNGKTIEQLFEITADSSTDTSPDFASDSTGDSTVDSSTDAVPDSETDSSTDPLTDSGMDASTDSTGDSISDSTGDTSGDSTVDTGTDTATDPSPDPGSGSGSSSDPMRVVAYFEEWGIYGRDFRVADINADELTHINYSFFGITPTEEDMPSMSSDLNVLPGGWVQDNYQGMNSNVPGELGIHDPWAAYEKPSPSPTNWSAAHSHAKTGTASAKSNKPSIQKAATLSSAQVQQVLSW